MTTDGKQTDSKNNISGILCQICKKEGHYAACWWFHYTDNHQESEIPEALAALQIGNEGASPWFPDTGATAHVTDGIVLLILDQIH